MRAAFALPLRRRHPLSQAWSLLVGLLVIGVVMVCGLIVAGVMLVGGALWLGWRQWRQTRSNAHGARRSQPDVLEGEYTVIRSSHTATHH